VRERRSEGPWDLLEAALAGHEAAFEELFESHERLLHYVVYKHRPSIVAYAGLQEVVDETWYQVLLRGHRGDYDTGVKFATWLCGLCLNVLKSRAFRPESAAWADDPDCAEESGAAGVAHGEEALEILAEIELLDALRECLGERSARERLVYEAIYVDGTTKTEAARRLGCSEAFVRQKLLPRLHERLRECLERKGYDGGP